jgi:hypothetical protein
MEVLMTREGRIFISRLIVVLVYTASLAALLFGDFLVTLITIGIGLLCWLFYLLAADLGTPPADGSQADGPQADLGSGSPLGLAVSRVIAGLGVVLALSAFITYGLEQNIWGGYTLNLLGPALAVAVLVVTTLPLVVLLLTSKPAAPVEETSFEPAEAPATLEPGDSPEDYEEEEYEEDIDEDEEEDLEDWDDEDAEDEDYDEEEGEEEDYGEEED